MTFGGIMEVIGLGFLDPALQAMGEIMELSELLQLPIFLQHVLAEEA